ncbi:MBL fold metallo-hydrolase [Bacillus salipaludis]|uniref:MBL fold metallo-hydrolase n=1 Tax=Bacillus salipaludis TaxID=2547811 RepID=A0A4R5VX89_9BACI|nr:MBL fold metallo-hydrolase [Bacillus salipaludis]MDQ6597585.1 MBL fold metallo-hydrolase [Bacillus salipaludis]TDK63001.1 MBL fold metallo-hydrolase [Bacillus salipaludis]
MLKKKRIIGLLSISLSFLLGVGLFLSPLHSAADQSQNKKEEASQAQMTSDFKVTLLGTGSPLLSIERFGPSTLVEVGEEKLLFDAGRGAALRLSQVNVMPGKINKLFITHLHSDHTNGIPDVWLTGSLPTAGKREVPFEVWGPKGTRDMMDHMGEAYAADIQGRKETQNENLKGLDAIGHDIDQGVVYENNGVQVIAFLVDHGSMKPSFGYRVNYNGHSVVISGDTRYNKNLIRHAKGTDLLIHEVAAARPEDETPAIQKILDIHTTPEQAGKVFNKVKPKLAVYSHIVLLGGLTDAEANLAIRTNKTYKGKVVVGEDLMSFEIGDKIRVIEP